jgi:heterotetrameric sarcosine oxidase delta subunit
MEFTYGGDGTVSRPDPQAASDAEWTDFVYFRDNPRGPHVELWQHTSGCRRWIKVRRDTLSHEILATGPADKPLKSKLGEGEAE